MARKKGALPDRALMAFTVAEQHEDVVGITVEPSAISDPAAEREAMAQGPGEDIDTWGAVLGVSPEPASVEAERVEFLERKEPEVREYRIERQRRLSLAENEPVPVRRIGV